MTESVAEHLCSWDAPVSGNDSRAFVAQDRGVFGAAIVLRPPTEMLSAQVKGVNLALVATPLLLSSDLSLDAGGGRADLHWWMQHRSVVQSNPAAWGAPIYLPLPFAEPKDWGTESGCCWQVVHGAGFVAVVGEFAVHVWRRAKNAWHMVLVPKVTYLCLPNAHCSYLILTGRVWHRSVYVGSDRCWLFARVLEASNVSLATLAHCCTGASPRQPFTQMRGLQLYVAA